MDLVGTPGTSEGVLVSHDRGLVGSELPTSSIQARWVIQACESLKLTIVSTFAPKVRGCCLLCCVLYTSW